MPIDARVIGLLVFQISRMNGAMLRIALKRWRMFIWLAGSGGDIRPIVSDYRARLT